MWYKIRTHFYVAKNRKVQWNVMCLYYKNIFINEYVDIIKYHIKIHINKNITIREIHICYATSIICLIFSVVFAVYFVVDVIQSSLQHISCGDVACRIARARSINIQLSCGRWLRYLCIQYLFCRFFDRFCLRTKNTKLLSPRKQTIVCTITTIRTILWMWRNRLEKSRKCDIKSNRE